eukprot:m.207236 g.207236  ORF g.207236 m.207236 type:complete len:243 (+) comp16916_c0_seq8:3-731(+)
MMMMLMVTISIVLMRLQLIYRRQEQGMQCLGQAERETLDSDTGQGLGAQRQGRVNPVPVQILPAGKSLDYIMNRRLNLEIAEEKRQKRQSVFDFLNNALSQKPSEGEGGYKDGQKRPASSSVAGQQDTNQPPEKAAKKSPRKSDPTTSCCTEASARRNEGTFRKDSGRNGRQSARITEKESKARKNDGFKAQPQKVSSLLITWQSTQKQNPQHSRNLGNERGSAEKATFITADVTCNPLCLV